MDRAQLPSDAVPSSAQQWIEEACRRFETAWRAGDRPRIEDFVGKPGGEKSARLRALLVLELSYRRQASETIAYDEYLQRFPDHAELVRELLGKVDTRLSDRSVAASGSAPLTVDTPPEPPGAETELPSHLGRYRITARLGRGGFGIVYKGHDDELGREVAIKVPHYERVSRPEDVEEYLREARLLASLEHPHIVPVYDVGRTEDGLCFVVSKFVTGGDLKARLLAGRPPVRDAADLVAAVADALHHAHRRGLIHRDVKPANILLEGRAGGVNPPVPYVADFGLALREEDFGRGSTFAGTPAYMSPEQARGEGHRVDGRSDVYSLGVVLYELLTGRRPFRGETVGELLKLIATAEAQPPRQVDDTIPRELERICLKALAKRASERYTTALDLAEDLRHWLAAPPSPPTPLPRGARGEQLLPSPPKRGRGVGGEGVCPPVALDAPTVPEAVRPGPAPSLLPAGPVRVVPKGLRSFDAGDADFFLELLPGPRDRDGLPDSLRFWKARIEETDPDRTFAVGLLYGPSGCGKSSLVKAGLLPRLAGRVVAVHVEATPEDTEARLLKALRKHCPSLGNRSGLVESVAELRRGAGFQPAGGPGQKVLIVLDQFEQWLHARRQEEDAELVHALRQCDGGRVQAIVLVRDDFWLAVSRFMTDLEVDLRQGDNAALVDLFDPLHARKVLAEFGRAFGRLPEDLGALSREQEAFLDRAVSGLSQDGKVISVRLALFAEMVKGKPWQPATLRDVGGTEGVGVTFLEETFSATTANPRHRLHQRAARAVLKALLPEQGTDIKGTMRSHQALLEASGYAARPRDFAELLRILDSELRLITPTDPEGADDDTPARSASESDAVGRISNPSGRDAGTDWKSVLPSADAADAEPVRPGMGERYYQLTHDYLVPSLREWLTRKQKETRRGRAELRLAERAALWNSKPESRHLPAWWEWLNIRLWTRKKDWTPPQRQMMRKAGRYHAVRGATLALVLLLLSVVGLVTRDRVVEQNRATHAAGLVQRLLDAETAQVPAIVAELEDYRDWADPLLRQEHQDAAPGSRRKLHTALALLPVDPGQRDDLCDRLLGAEPHEVPVLVQALQPHGQALKDRLWGIAEKPPPGKEAQRLRAACALAAYDPNSPRWDRVAVPVVEQLVAENAVYLGQWLEGFRPVSGRLLAPLADVFRNRKDERASERRLATNILADYASERPELLADLLLDADEKQFAVLYPKFKDQRERGLPVLTGEVDKRLPADAKDDAKEKLAKRQANAAVSLLRMNQPAKVWPLLKHRPDPRVRSYLIHRLGPLGAEAGALVKQLAEEPDVTIRRALILSLGPEEFGKEAWTPEGKKLLVQQLRELYRTADDPGLRAAAEWLLQQWKQEQWLRQTDEAWAKDRKQRDKRLADIQQHLASEKGKAKPQWYVTGQGQTMVVIPGPVEFRMGSPPTEAGRSPSEQQHRKRIGRTFAIAAKPVTVRDYLRYRPGYDYLKQYAPEEDCPVHGTNWYMAAAYCNWLSEQEGIAKEQWCYETNRQGQVTKLKEKYLSLTGYRLPTEAEWEYVCRAGAVTSRYYGETAELLGKYGWYFQNSGERTWPVGGKKPNDLGLFDMHGNVYTWCQESYKAYPEAEGAKVYDDIEDILSINTQDSRVLRGGAYGNHASVVRSALRFGNVPALRLSNVGFRPARTFR